MFNIGLSGSICHFPICHFPMVAFVPRAKQETWVQSLGQEDPPEEEMATHSSILTWQIPWTEELQSMESLKGQM